MKKLLRAWISAAALGSAFVSQGAAAQAPPEAPAPGADEATRSSARELGEQGNALFASGDYAGAIEKFERANALVPVPTLGVRIARCLEKLGRLVEASERYLAVQRAGLPPQALPVHERALEEARVEREALLPRIPALVVTVAPADAQALVDGVPVQPELLGEKRMVDPGRRVVEARRGDASRRVEVDVAEGAVVPVHIGLDGSVAPPAGASTERERGSSAWPFVGYGLLGVGAASTIVGVATGLAAMGQRSDLEASCGEALACPPSLHADADSYNSLRTVSAVTFFAGLGLAAAGVTIVLVDPGGSPSAEASSPERARAALRIGPGSLGLQGAF